MAAVSSAPAQGIGDAQIAPDVTLLRQASPAASFVFVEFEPRPRIIAHCHDHDARHREATTSLRDTLRARAQEQASQTWRSASKSSGELGMVEQQIHELRRSVERGGAAIVAKPIAAELNA